MCVRSQARCLEAVDVDTGEAAMVPVSVELQGAAPPLRKVTPCILPPLNAVVSVQV